MKKIWAILLCMLLVLTTVAGPAQAQEANQTEVIVLCMGRADTELLSKAAALKEQNDDAVVLLAFGSLYGSQFSALDNTQALSKVLNESDIDGVLLGKTDLLHTVSDLNKVLRECEVPMVATNVYSANTPFALQSLQVEEDGRTILILSLVGSESKKELPQLETISLKDELKTLKEALNQAGDADEILLFAENVDKDTLLAIQKEYGEKLSAVIVDKEMGEGFITAGKGPVILRFSVGSKTTAKVSKIDPAKVKTDKELDQKIKKLINTQGAVKDRVITSIYRELLNDKESLYSKDSELGFFVTDAIKHQSGAGAVIVPAEMILKGINSGEVKAGDVLGLLDENEMIVGVELTGEELRTIVTDTLQHEGIEAANFAHFAGISGVYAEGELTTLLVGNKEVKDGTNYLVAMPQSALNTMGYDFLKTKEIKLFYGNGSMMLYNYAKAEGIPVSEARFSENAAQTGKDVSSNAMTWPVYLAMPIIFVGLYFLNKLDPKMKERFDEVDRAAALEKERMEAERQARLKEREERKAAAKRKKEEEQEQK